MLAGCLVDFMLQQSASDRNTRSDGAPSPRPNGGRRMSRQLENQRWPSFMQSITNIRTHGLLYAVCRRTQGPQGRSSSVPIIRSHSTRRWELSPVDCDTGAQRASKAHTGHILAAYSSGSRLPQRLHQNAQQSMQNTPGPELDGAPTRESMSGDERMGGK